jgi:hypothetical protein
MIKGVEGMQFTDGVSMEACKDNATAFSAEYKGKINLEYKSDVACSLCYIYLAVS